MTDTTANWMKKFAGKVPASPVYNVAQALDNPFVQARAGVVAAHTPEGKEVMGVAAPIRCSGAVAPLRAAPAMGADTDALLTEAGFTAQQIQFLREHAVI